MKNLVYSIAIAVFFGALMQGCSKSSNNYTTTDHTVGMISTRTWSGTSSGFYKGDTTLSSGTVTWALHFGRIITDTNFAILKVDGFLVNVLGTPVHYQSTDSTTTQTVVFDSSVTGTQTAILTYYYLHDSMTYQLNYVSGYNAAAAQYYQTNMVMHTNHS